MAATCRAGCSLAAYQDLLEPQVVLLQQPGHSYQSCKNVSRSCPVRRQPSLWGGPGGDPGGPGRAASCCGSHRFARLRWSLPSTAGAAPFMGGASSGGGSAGASPKPLRRSLPCLACLQQHLRRNGEHCENPSEITTPGSGSHISTTAHPTAHECRRYLRDAARHGRRADLSLSPERGGRPRQLPPAVLPLLLIIAPAPPRRVLLPAAGVLLLSSRPTLMLTLRALGTLMHAAISKRKSAISVHVVSFDGSLWRPRMPPCL